MRACRNRSAMAVRDRGCAAGGIRPNDVLLYKQRSAHEIDEQLHLLKKHLPYHESDHVLNIAYNPLCDGTCFQDMELRRNDENFLDALGARRTPDPTTSGDFCRRFEAGHIYTLLDIINDTRLKAWAGQPRAFFGRALIDMDGSLVATTGACKRGMDI